MRGMLYPMIAICSLLMTISTHSIFAQNLVPNSSFETYSSCPTGNSQIHLVAPWQRPGGSITSPDYCNSCYSQVGVSCSSVGVPSNFGGASNVAHTGEGYTGIFTHYTSCGNCREYIQVPLVSSLVAGQTYSVGFWALRSDYARYASDHLDLYISQSAPTQPVNQPITGVTPQIVSGVVTDRDNWTLISGTYTAIGGEQWLTIGNFTNTSGTFIQDNGSQGGACALVTAGAYYFIDDVFVQDVTILNTNLMSFDVESIDRNRSLISWSIDDSDSYQSLTIQYSDDGLVFNDIFETKEIDLEAWIDPTRNKNKSYYRLRLMSDDGAIFYSDIKVIEFNFDDQWSSTAIHVFPNPSRGHITIRCNDLELFTNAKLVIYNTLWQPVILVNAAFEANSMTVNTDRLTSGVYYLQLESSHHSHTQKILID